MSAVIRCPLLRLLPQMQRTDGGRRLVLLHLVLLNRSLSPAPGITDSDDRRFFGFGDLADRLTGRSKPTHRFMTLPAVIPA